LHGSTVIVLAGTAATVGFVHTILGPDHYLPFIAISKARGWSARRTLVITAACGVGHVLSSIVLGFVGIGIGAALFRLEAIEAFRGELAAWFLIAFGFTYFVWGLHRALRRRPHEHEHRHGGGVVHSHAHAHTGEHSHPHASGGRSLTPWVLFLIFVFGPCEPLIPLIMFPAAEGSMLDVAVVASVFGLVTVGTMLGVVAVAYHGISRVRVRGLERYAHALAGLTIFVSGGAITFLGL
jgi:sulfite exporter TauE/SafE